MSPRSRGLAYGPRGAHNVQNQGVPSGAAVAFMMRPTTMPSDHIVIVLAPFTEGTARRRTLEDQRGHGRSHRRAWVDRYPDWWRGKRFDAPTVGWVAGTTNETTRDTVQRILVGRPDQQGTGAIPKDAIIEIVSARGIPDLLDGIKVRHVSGGISA